MRKDELVETLSASIPEVEVPIPGVVKKTPGKLSFTSLKRLANKAGDSVQTEVKKFIDWVLEHVPEPVRKRTKQKINNLKKKIVGLFDEVTRFNPKEYKNAFSGFLKTYFINGHKGYDAENFLDRAAPKVLKPILLIQTSLGAREANQRQNIFTVK